MLNLRVITLIYISFLSTSYNLEWFYIVGSFGCADLFMPPLLLVTLIKRKIHLDYVCFSLIGLAIISCISYLHAALLFDFENRNPGYVFRSIYFVGLYLLILNSTIRTEDILKAIMVGLVLSLFGAFYIWSSSPRYFGFTSMPMLHVLDSPTGLVVNRNETGLFSSLLFTISFFSLAYQKLFTPRIMAVLVLISFLSVSLSFSKGAWILSLAGFLFVSVFRFNMLQMICIYSVPLILLVAFETVDFEFFDAVVTRFTNSGETNSYRVTYILESLLIGMDNFLLGIGPGNYQEYTINNGLTVTTDPHNAFTQSFAELGFLGVFIVIGMYVASIIKSFRKIRTSDTYVVIFALIMLLLMDSLQSGLSLSIKITYVLFALSARAIYATQED
jgi:O-antigen ligase